MRRSPIVTLAVLTALALAAPAAASGPQPGGSPALVDQLTGVRDVYLVVKQPTTTLVEERDQASRALVHRWEVPGTWGLPQVTQAFSAFASTGLGGLSTNGRTLVLEQPITTYPATSAHFLVIDTTGKARPRTFSLAGGFAYDALSPSADTLYLIQDVGGSGFTDYRVRAYDLRAGKLLPKPIMDRVAHETVMHGWPVARTTSQSGSWVFTLYTGGHYPFVHALHASARSARCIDLPRRLNPAQVWLGPHQRTLTVATIEGRSLATIDLRTMHVSLTGRARS